MSVLGKRRSSSARGRRNSHSAIKPKTLTLCLKCKKPVQPHLACKSCGTYRGRVVMKTMSERRAKKARTEARDKAARGEAK